MAKIYNQLNEELSAFILEQKIFFTGSAAEDGRINVSPKGTDSLRVLNERQILWLNLTGSGNETAAHLRKVNRITLMFCAFEGAPLILRVYGRAQTIHRRDPEWNSYYEQFPANKGARNIFLVDIESVQTSCGFAVPLMNYKEDRTILTDWSAKQSEEEMHAYWKKKNLTSIDGLETGLFDD
jgi:hypothetical protein